MRNKLIALLGFILWAAGTSFAADTIDGMTNKVTGGRPEGLPPVTTGAQALITRQNDILLNAYPGELRIPKRAPYSAILYHRLLFTTPTAARTVTFPNGSGTVALQASAALTSAETISFAPASSVSAYTLTPAHTATINAVTTGAIAGRAYHLVITTSGTTSYTLTFGTAFKTTGTLATGTSTAKVFVMQFIFDGTNFNEVSRTTAM